MGALSVGGRQHLADYACLIWFVSRGGSKIFWQTAPGEDLGGGCRTGVRFPPSPLLGRSFWYKVNVLFFMP